MMPLALFFAASVIVVDDPVTIPAGQWRALELGLKQKPGRVDCAFEVRSRGSGVRVMLMTMLDLKKMGKGASFAVLDATPYLREGRFSYRVPRPGDYVIVIDNRFEGRGPATVHLRVTLDFSEDPAIKPRYAPSQTRLTVVLLSMLFLLAVITYVAKRFAG